MKENKSQIALIAAILVIAAIIAYVCYGIIKSSGKDEAGNIKFGKNPIATMDVKYTDKDGNEKTGTIKMELYPDVAPISVANFVGLANNGFYDGLTFHRIMSDFMIQGGDPEGDGSGTVKISKLDKSIEEGSSKDYSYSIKGEFAANGIYNSLKFQKGVVGMARADYSNMGYTEEGYNSGSSQFFIVTSDKDTTLSNLNQIYASFGKVIEGYDVVEEIANVEVTESDSGEKSKPTNAPVITSVRVDTFGANYGVPETINYDEIKSKITQYQDYMNQIYSSSNVETGVDNSEEAPVEYTEAVNE